MLGSDCGDGRLLVQGRGDIDQLLLQLVETLRSLQQRDLQIEHQQVEALGLFRLAFHLVRQRSQFVDEFLAHVLVQRAPGFRRLILLHQRTLAANDEIVEIHRGDVGFQEGERAIADRLFIWRRVGARIVASTCLRDAWRLLQDLLLVQSLHDIEPRCKEALAEGFCVLPFVWRQILAEEFQVLAVVENAEEFLVLAGAEEIRAKARAATDDLPELRLRADQLEEHEVDDLRYVDAGVEHVDGNGDMRIAILLREVVDQ